VLKEGYEKVYIVSLILISLPELRVVRFQNKPGLFKIATFRRWIVVPSGSELIEEVMKAPDSTLSVREPLQDVRTAVHIAQTCTQHSHLSFFKPNIPSAS
jgi:hypothetical protein